MSIHQTENLLFFTLLQLAIITLAGRFGGAAARGLGQPAVIGEIAVGILLGPSFMGAFAPSLFETVFKSTTPDALLMLSQIGLIFLMFQVGQEFKFSQLSVSKYRNVMLSVAVASIILPFGLGYFFCYLSPDQLYPYPDRLNSALFTGTALSITALPILGRIMMDYRLNHTAIGVIAISAAAINDVIGWILLALVSALTTAAFAPETLLQTIASILIYISICWWCIRPLMKLIIKRFGSVSEPLTGNVLGLFMFLIFVSAMTTYKIGIFAIFGGFMLGILVHDEPNLVRAWRDRVGSFVTVFFLPVFFTYTGLRTHIGKLNSVDLWVWCLILISFATFGKYGAAYCAARVHKLSHPESTIIGIMMNTRALMELVVINVGLDLGVISPEVFTMLVVMAIFSTVLTAPVLRGQLQKLALVKAG